MPTRLAVLWLVLSTLMSPPVLAAQRATAGRGDIELPPLSWTCPMHPEIVDDKTGACPICKMALVSVRLELDWSCPVHTSVIEATAGRCPVCRRNLVQVTAAVSWTCPAHPEIKATSPGRCTIDGGELVVTRERRPHGDHNPRHGGLFFMAADNTHHLEATYPSAGVFRVFVYDEYTRLLPLKGVTARAVTREVGGRELEAFPLRPSKDGMYLEARIGPRALPIEVTAKVRFAPKAPEQRFDFSFGGYTSEPSPTVANIVAATPTPSPSALGVPEPPAASVTVPALLADLTTQNAKLQALLQQGAYADMYFPALVAKEAALALEQRANQLSATRQAQISEAVRRVVLAAWLIDMYGDLGNKPKLTEAYQAFASAVTDLKSGYAIDR